MTQKTIVIIGGGAAGMFAALAAAKQAPHARVILLEKTRQLLAKVRISGGGRCNVTHAQFDPKLLVHNYPRGAKELLGPLHRFQPRDTVQWFLERGVRLKTEEDGRMFPVTDSSETIIECLISEARKCHVEIRTEQKISEIHPKASGFEILFENQPPLTCTSLLLATGSSPQGYGFAEKMGHTIIPLVPSLFTFNVPSSPLLDLSGIAVEDAEISLKETSLKQRGPLLLTHWGFSGPASLKLSAWAARELHAKQYQAEINIHWLPSLSKENITQKLLSLKKQKPLKHLENENLFFLPSNLWKRLVRLAQIKERTPISHISNPHLQKLTDLLIQSTFRVEGKTTNKQEFVTCGGIDLKEIDFKTMQSRKQPGLYFAGECLNIDGVTGGFNFQNAWTTGWIAAHAMAEHNE
jgi:predicted Rossmann fold flavoprotein